MLKKRVFHRINMFFVVLKSDFRQLTCFYRQNARAVF
jgi:hypothetical protein